VNVAFNHSENKTFQVLQQKQTMKKTIIAFLFFLPLYNCYGQVNKDTLKATIKVPEFPGEKTGARFSGWIGYTTSRTENIFAPINNNNWFPTLQDRIHDFSFAGSYRITSRFLFSANLIQSNGNLVTSQLTRYSYNSYNTPGTKRLDMSATLEGHPHLNFQNSWSLRIYNINGYWNDGNVPGIVENKILPKPVPAVSWNIRFH
jgi:hypothetical protein